MEEKDRKFRVSYVLKNMKTREKTSAKTFIVDAKYGEAAVGKLYEHIGDKGDWIIDLDSPLNYFEMPESYSALMLN